MALGFERATWARRRGRPVGRVSSAPSRRAGSIRPLAGAAARPAAAVVPAAASASASRANWLAFDERPSSQNPDCNLNIEGKAQKKIKTLLPSNFVVLTYFTPESDGNRRLREPSYFVSHITEK